MLATNALVLYTSFPRHEPLFGSFTSSGKNTEAILPGKCSRPSTNPARAGFGLNCILAWECDRRVRTASSLLLPHPAYRPRDPANVFGFSLWTQAFGLFADEILVEVGGNAKLLARGIQKDQELFLWAKWASPDLNSTLSVSIPIAWQVRAADRTNGS